MGHAHPAIMERPDKTTKTIAWNGLEYTVPKEWEAVVTEQCHLLFEHDLEPVLELKWHQHHAVSLDEAHANVLKQLSREFSAPDKTETLSGTQNKHQIRKFYWAHNKQSIFLLFCPLCHTSILVRPYIPSADPLQISEALHCHKAKDFTRWAVQDFSFLLPHSYGLDTYNFTMGFTRISLKEHKTCLHLCRMMPAANYLKNESLESLLRKITGCPSSSTPINQQTDYIELWQEPSLFSQLRIRMRRQKPFIYGRLWHHQSSDKLLGYTIESIKPPSTSMIEQIYHDHEAAVS